MNNSSVQLGPIVAVSVGRCIGFIAVSSRSVVAVAVRGRVGGRNRRLG